MNRIIFCKLLSIVLLLNNSIAKAGIEEFKDAIWKECDKAKAEAANFQGQDRVAAVDFLKGIISLNLTNAGENPLVNPGIIKAPEGIQSDVSFAQSLDPERSNRAKKCTADILPILIPESGLTLPALLLQSEDTNNNLDVRAAYSRVAYSLAQKLSTPPVSIDTNSTISGYQVSETLIDELFEFYLKTHSTLTEEIISLYPAQLIARISTELLNSNCVLDCSQEVQLSQLLAKLDLHLQGSKELLIELIEKVRPEIRLLVLQALQYSTSIFEPLLKVILPRLEGSQNPERVQLFQNLNSIFNYELRTATLAVDPKDRLLLLKSFESSSGPERDVLEKGLVVIAPLYPEFTESIKALVLSKDQDLRARAARLLSHVAAPTNETKKLFASLLADKAIEVQQIALQSSLSGTDSTSLLNRAQDIYNKIKKSSLSKQINEQQELEQILSLLRTISQLPISTLPAGWNKISLEAIEAGLIQNRAATDLSPALSLLSVNTKKTLADLRLYARSSDASKRNTAVFIIQRGFIPDASIFDTLLMLLADSDANVSKNAQLALLMLTPNLRDLMSAKRKLAPSPRLDEILLESGLHPELAVEVQREVTEVSCSEISELAGACLSRTINGAFCSIVVSQIPRCVDSAILETLPGGTVEKAINIQPQIRELFDQALFNAQTGQNAQLEIGLFLLRAKAGSEKIISRLCGLANIASDGALSEIVGYAATDPLSAKSCLDILRKYFEDNKVESSKKAQLFKYILKLDPKAINVAVMLKDALERQELDFLRILAQAELVNELLPILSEVLNENNSSSSEQDRLIALQLLEELGEKAVNQYPVILPLLQSQSNEIRYSAARAIIACNADHQASLKALRSIINSPKIRELLIHHDIKALPALIDELLQDSSANISSLERRNLLRLLRALRGPDASIPEPLDEDIMKEADKS